MDPSPAVDDAPADLSGLSLTELRAERARVRRALELAHLRSRPATDDRAQVDVLAARVRQLTDELIRRYADDLSLVDSLLIPAYPRGKGSEPAPEQGGAER